MLIRLLSFLTILASVVLADVQITTPAGGATVAGGKTLSVQWKDSGDDPPLDDLTSYSLFLMAGGNDEAGYIQLAAIAQNALFSNGNAASGTIQANLGGPDKNAYFLKMMSAAPGGQVINYSDRFTLSGMTGTFPPSVVAGLKDVEGTKGPETENNVDKNAANPAAAGADGTQLAYSLQTGPTKFAPMQRKPGTKITNKNATPLYPTSSYKIAKTKLPTPSQVTTVTASVTWSVSSIENPATPQPGPGGQAMQKFLNRWRD